MSNERPESSIELIDWSVRRLGGDNLFGAPTGCGFLDVMITKQQALDRVQEAVYRFNREHFNGYRKTGLIFQGEANKTKYTLPENIIEVLEYYKVDDRSSIFSFDYQMRQSMAFNFGRMGGFDLVTVELTYEYLKMLDMKIGEKYNYEFNELTHELNIMTKKQNDFQIALICYMLEDVEQYTDVWQDIWLKEYVFQLIKRQWGENLQKFGNVTLPGGANINAEEIYRQADEEIKRLEEQLETKYSHPPMFFIG